MGCGPSFIGGAPMQQLPSFAPMSYGQSFPVTNSVPAAFAQQVYPPTYPQSQPVSYPQGWHTPAQPVQQAAAPSPLAKPKVRAKRDDEPTPAVIPTRTVLSLPAPETLDIGALRAPVTPTTVAPNTPVTPTTVDWNSTRARLNQMGALSFNLVKLPGGTHRMVITLPTSNPNQTRLIEVEAQGEATAVATALHQAEESNQR
jgi:hypothetical protein